MVLSSSIIHVFFLLYLVYCDHVTHILFRKKILLLSFDYHAVITHLQCCIPIVISAQANYCFDIFVWLRHTCWFLIIPYIIQSWIRLKSLQHRLPWKTLPLNWQPSSTVRHPADLIFSYMRNLGHYLPTIFAVFYCAHREWSNGANVVERLDRIYHISRLTAGILDYGFTTKLCNCKRPMLHILIALSILSRSWQST